jgi:hypothetical protein
MPHSNIPKRIRKDSARKREGNENTEAVKRHRAEKKADVKVRKDRRNKAAEDSLLVEREGESLELTKLHG